MSTDNTEFVRDENQARASDPEASAWVSANAGTGKTAVLVRRVLRLLLAGTKPEKILCLTYTKNAAAEMENRLLAELASWAIESEEKLAERIGNLIGGPFDSSLLERARRLFARTLEAEGGLKTFTIHGFCERVLQRFPLEAGVAPNFNVLDGREAKLLRGEAFDTTIARIAEDDDSPLAKALLILLGRSAEGQLREMIDKALEKKATLGALRGSGNDWMEVECRTLKRLLGVEQERQEALLASMLAAVDDQLLDEMIAALTEAGSTKIDQDLVAELGRARAASGEMRLSALRRAFYDSKGETPLQRLCGAQVKRAAPALCDRLKAAQDIFVSLDNRLGQLRAAESTTALLLLADAIQTEYERRKRADAALDYDDLIEKTANLFVGAGMASWVLFKMDQGIDHILVDEAQDTNPAQWTIIKSLVEEFFAGKGASDNLRTLFAVGDEKQSIYSFQGAEPARFGEAGREFRRKAETVRLSFHAVPLTLSFRSTEPILEAVDAVFAQDEAAKGLTWQEEPVTHVPFRKGQPGLVEIWDVEKPSEATEVSAFEPWNDRNEAGSAVERLCQRIALTIKAWLSGAEGGVLESKERRIRPGDILILVQRRDPLTTPMIRALKQAKIPVAGADRMLLMQQLAVQDLVALAEFLLMQEDDLALAVVLKSPFFNLDDDALLAIAPARDGKPLWKVLNASEDPRFDEAKRRLNGWLARADLTPPYEFFSELLATEGGLMRKRLLTRLGPEAADAIDEFLGLALLYDREAAPSLQGFIAELSAGDLEVKRDMEQDRDEVRIMTVHGAKGLQAPIVFLPDTCRLPKPPGARLYEMATPGAAPDETCHLIWPVAGRPHDAIEAAKSDTKDAETEESHRLLYVAMTRAEDRLYVCGWLDRNKSKQPKGCWYELIDKGLTGLLSPAEGLGGHTVRRLELKPPVPVVVGAEPVQAVGEAVVLPSWAITPAPSERSPFELRPSRLAAGQIGATGETEQPTLGPSALADNARFARGRLVHALLQHLPEIRDADRERAARVFVAARSGGLPETMQGEIITESLAIAGDPNFAPLFAERSLAEVPVVARFGTGADQRALSGQIDRLAVLDDYLLILDYKTNRPPPSRIEDVAPAYISQLAAYRLALSRLFPDKEIRAALLWTDGPKLMPIPSTYLDDAERRILQSGPSLDVAEGVT
jgi:ATP-dependent helicase/nuclease subunit A